MGMLRRYLLVIFCLLALTSFLFAQNTTETIEIATYYPAPYGSYAELTTTGNTSLATEGGRVGIGTNTPQAALDVRGGIKVGNEPTCDSAHEGVLRYNLIASQMEFCNKDFKWTLPAGFYKPQYQRFTASGTFTVPEGVTKIMVEVYGGGGGGGGGSCLASCSYSGSGGGGGAYAKGFFSVSSGETFAVTVGDGGNGGSGCGLGSDGGDSIFGGLLMAGGGKGPKNANWQTGAGGTSAAELSFNGGDGGEANTFGGSIAMSGPGGKAGGNGGAGGSGYEAGGQPGVFPGGGGSGAASRSPNYTGCSGTGGNGAGGLVIVWW